LLLVAADSGALLVIVAGGVIAALGYVGRLVVETWRGIRAQHAKDRARLLELEAMLLAGHAVLLVQLDLARRLTLLLEGDEPAVVERTGYENLFVRRFPGFTEEEAVLHDIIRAYTEHATRPLNRATLDWIQSDSYYRYPRRTRGSPLERVASAQLAAQLNALHAHLLLWFAKYEAWIPNHREHALCFLADEEEHGLEFPVGIEQTVRRVLGASNAADPTRDTYPHPRAS
jgi:hypothetical protein